MKLFKKGETYSWDFNKFYFFTESEKCSILNALKEQVEIFSKVEDFNVKGGMCDMDRNLIKELEQCL
ncbi:hypothetical protein LCGC14_0770450 [marine sediment metagenome]|uniref:Uncharacterized protein n=1 Tax=marine sediment metagenome TaxID=412755 RepID=A0A0F9Q2M1_9ZZZZ